MIIVVIKSCLAKKQVKSADESKNNFSLST